MRILVGRLFMGVLAVAALSTPASAWQCVARSTNGAMGAGSGIILERAQKFALNRCIAAGGNIPGYACSIVRCR
jgi:hypothetical protein